MARKKRGGVKREPQGRMIRRSLFGSADVCELSPLGVALWVGIIVFADDEGRIRTGETWLRRRIFPTQRLTLHRVRTQLTLMESQGMLARVQEGSVTYYQVTNFHQYQDLRFVERARLEGEDGRGKGEEGEGPRAPAEQPAYQEGPEIGNSPDGLDEVLHFLTNVLRYQKAITDQAAAVKKLLELGTVPEDIVDWCGVLGQEIAKTEKGDGVKDPHAYVGSLMLRWKNPKEKPGLVEPDREAEDKAIIRKAMEDLRQEDEKNATL